MRSGTFDFTWLICSFHLAFPCVSDSLFIFKSLIQQYKHNSILLSIKLFNRLSVHNLQDIKLFHMKIRVGVNNNPFFNPPLQGYDQVVFCPIEQFGNFGVDP